MLFKPVTRIAAACALLFSQTATSATLQEVLRQSLQNDPELLEAKANQDAANTDINIAKSGHLPTVSLTATQILAQKHRYESNARSKLNPGLQGKLNLYSFGGIDARVRYNEYKYDYYHHKYYETQEILGQTIGRLYLSALRAKESLQAAQNNLQRHDQIIGDLKIITQYDKGRQSELDQALARRLRVQAYIAEQTRIMELNLSRLGKYTQTRLSPAALRDPFIGENAISVMRRYQSRDLANQPSYQAQQAERASALAELDVNKASRYPTIDLIASATRDNKEIYVNFGWDFYNPTANYQVERSSHTIVAAEAKSEQILRDVSERTRSAEVDMKQSLNRLHIAEQQIAAQKKVIKAYELQFKIARRTLLDVLDSYSDLWNIELEAVSSRNDFRDAALEYLSSQAAIAKWAGLKQDRNAPVRPEPKSFKDHLPDNFLPQNFQERLAAFDWFKGKEANSENHTDNQVDTTNPEANPFSTLDQDPALNTVAPSAPKATSGSKRTSKHQTNQVATEPVLTYDEVMSNIQANDADHTPAIDDSRLTSEPVLSYTDIMNDAPTRIVSDESVSTSSIPKSAKKAAKAKKASQQKTNALSPQEKAANALIKANNLPITEQLPENETSAPTETNIPAPTEPDSHEPTSKSPPATDKKSVSGSKKAPKINTTKLMQTLSAQQQTPSASSPTNTTPPVQLIDAPEHGVVWQNPATNKTDLLKKQEHLITDQEKKTHTATKTRETAKEKTKALNTEIERKTDAKKEAKDALKKGKNAIKTGQTTLKPALENNTKDTKSSKNKTTIKNKTVSANEPQVYWVLETRVPYEQV